MSDSRDPKMNEAMEDVRELQESAAASFFALEDSLPENDATPTPPSSPRERNPDKIMELLRAGSWPMHRGPFSDDEVAALRRGKCLTCGSFNLQGDAYGGEHRVFCVPRFGYGCGAAFLIPPLPDLRATPTPPTAPPRERESEPTIGEPGTLVTFSSPDLLAAASLPPSAEARDLCLGRSPGAGAYACTRKRGHDGEHRNGVTSWDAPPPAGSGETEP